MPDFANRVRTHLEGSSVSEDVIEELAAHLEDHYEAERSGGKSDADAMKSVTMLLGNRERFLERILESQGGVMNSVSRHVVLPGLVGSLICVVGYQLLQLESRSHLLPLFIGPKEAWGRAGWVPMSIPMLLVLLFAGAAATVIAQRLGAMKRKAFYAAIFPGAVLLVGFVSRFIVETVQHGFNFESATLWWAYAGFFIGFVVVPALAFMAGALPFVLETSRIGLAE